MPFSEISFSAWLLLVAAAFAVGLSKAGFGGFGMAAVLLMAMVLPAKESTGAVLPLLIFADLFAVSAFWRHTRWEFVWKLLPASVLGVVAGFLVMPIISDEVFRPVIGWIILSLVGLILVHRFTPLLSRFAATHPAFAWPMGILAGLTTMLANAAGPITTLYLLACRLPRMEFVGTAAWYFLIVNVIKVPFSATLGLINPHSLLINLALLPGVAAGIFIGRWLLGKVSQTLFEILLIVFSVAGALKLIVG